MRLVFLALLMIGSSHAMAQTSVGDPENAVLAQRYQTYLQSGKGCVAVNEGPHVIITGFGLFEGVAFNISGAVVGNLSSELWWPRDMNLNHPVLQNQVPVVNGILTNDDHGVRFDNREFVIGSVKVSACLITFDVGWDVPGAILAYEMTKFQPQVVVMTGLGGDNNAEIESASINYAVSLEGYNADGSGDPADTPVNPLIDPADPVNAVVKMNWNQEQIATVVKPLTDQVHAPLSVPSGPAPNNDYICNNISFIAAEAAQNHKLDLAGGKIEIQPNVKSQPKIGFFHYPLNAQLVPGDVFIWSQVILTIAAQGL